VYLEGFSVVLVIIGNYGQSYIFISKSMLKMTDYEGYGSATGMILINKNGWT